MTHHAPIPDLDPWDESRVVQDWNDESQDTTFSLPKRKLEEAEMDITPMIDITFLLLIFFTVASRISVESQVALPKARHGTAVPSKSSVIITLTAAEGELANIFKGDAAVDSTRVVTKDLAEQEQELVAYIENGILVEHREQVIIKAEREVKAREVARVGRAVGAVDGAKLFVAVLEKQ